MPELRLLRYFSAVAEELNFTRAAERLYIAQPSLSAAIRQLEKQLGVTLFDRDTRRVALTAAGEALLPHALEALSAVDRGVRAARGADAPALEVLRVLFTMPLEPLVLDALDRIEALPQGLPTTARGSWAEELLSDVRAERADVGVLRFPGGDRSGLAFHSLGGDRACALVAEDHPFAQQAGVTVAELASAPIVLWAPELGLDGYNSYVRGLFDGAGEQLVAASTRRLDVPGWRPVTRGQAIGIVGASERAPGGTTLVPIEHAPPLPVLLAYRDGLPPECLERIVACLRAALEAHGSKLPGRLPRPLADDPPAPAP